MTIKVPVSMTNPEIGRRTADQEILADAAEFTHMSGQPVAIVSGDIAMRLRATLLEALDIVVLDDNLRRNRTNPTRDGIL